MRSWILLFAGASTLALATPRPAWAREMHWKSLAVTARLDADGALHIRERHHVVMTGEWNGGERVFLIKRGQDLQLEAMRRVDPGTGAVHAMREGSLGEVDEYGWTSGHTLRWRSRLPGDAYFDDTDLVHEIDYTLYGALQREGDGFRLAHEFAFLDRPGVIESFLVDLAVDPAWEVDGGHAIHAQSGPLAPGQGHILHLGLRPVGGAAPSIATLSPFRQRLVLALVLAPLLLLLQLFASEWIRGRFAPLDPRQAAQTLDRDLLAHPAEVVGAVWDRTVGPDEVGALVARLAAEGRIRTRVQNVDELSMELLVDRDQFTGYERELIDGFFFSDRPTTSTSDIRAHYKTTGFDPAGKIRPGVEEKAEALAGPPPVRLPVWLPTALAFFGGTYAAWTAVGDTGSRIAGVIAVVLPPLLLGGIGVAAAGGWRARIDRGPLGAWRFLVPIGILIGLGIEAVMGFRHLPLVSELVTLKGGLVPARMLGAVLLVLAFVNSIVNSARSRERMQGIALRKRLASARRYFEDEFEKPEPALRDEWFPYVLALGLDQDSQRWFRHYGAAASVGSSRGWPTSNGSSSSGSSSSSGPTGWTGGGGAFGGAGATASWAAAAGALSSGVAAPSSSGGSGGGGGGGGGSSSGGGGGGGW
jgi:uncharacterized membrane protein YgcG